MLFLYAIETKKDDKLRYSFLIKIKKSIELNQLDQMV